MDKFKKGEKVIFIETPKSGAYKRYLNQECTIYSICSKYVKIRFNDGYCTREIFIKRIKKIQQEYEIF